MAKFRYCGHRDAESSWWRIKYKMSDSREMETYTGISKVWKKIIAKLCVGINTHILQLVNDRLELVHGEVKKIRNQCDKINEEQKSKSECLEKNVRGIQKKLESMDALEENIRSINKQLEISQDAFVNLQNNNVMLEEIKSMIDMYGVKIARLERLRAQKEGAVSLEHHAKLKIQEPMQDVYGGLDYFEFENHFRGTRAQIKNSQRIYLDYFKGKKKVIDLGCGRGEFLELMKENGIDGYGVDLYPEFVDLCRSKGLQAVCADVSKVLEDEQEVDGIFAGQLIEHLSFRELIHLTELAYSRLLPESYLIYETPNPMSLAIYSHSFYIDPSHNKPVHPLTIKYVLEKAGFKDIHIKFTESSKLPVEIPELVIENAENLEAFNMAMKTVEHTLFGSQDYAVIARK